MLNDHGKAERLTAGLVSALYLATAALLGLLLYFTVKGIQNNESALAAHQSIPATSCPSILPGESPGAFNPDPGSIYCTLQDLT